MLGGKTKQIEICLIPEIVRNFLERVAFHTLVPRDVTVSAHVHATSGALNLWPVPDAINAECGIDSVEHGTAFIVGTEDFVRERGLILHLPKF